MPLGLAPSNALVCVRVVLGAFSRLVPQKIYRAGRMCRARDDEQGSPHAHGRLDISLYDRPYLLAVR